MKRYTNASWFDPKYPLLMCTALFASLEYHFKVLQSAGYDDMEFWPLGNPIRQIKKGLPLLSHILIASLHQVPLVPVSAPARFLGKMGLASDLRSSIPLIMQVEEEIGQSPKVLFIRELQADPEADVQLPSEWKAISGEGQKYIQPDPEVYRWLAKVNNLDVISHPLQFIYLLSERGMDGIVLDTTHATRPHKITGERFPLSDWRVTFQPWLESGVVSYAHLRLGSNMPQMDPLLGAQELYDVLYGHGGNTDIIEKLRMLLTYNLDIVVEVDPGGYQMIRASEGKRMPLASGEFVELLTRIRERIDMIEREVLGT